MSDTVRVCLVGLGAIGRDVLKALVERPRLRLVAAADVALAGRDAGELAGLGAMGIPVHGQVRDALGAGGDVDVALVLTSSGVENVVPVIEASIEAGVDVISTCEELACAAWATPDLAARLDAAARARGATVLGTGVNPGFVMDRLPLQIAGACVRVDAVHVERVLDAAKRRGPLRAKVGADLTPDEFRAGVAAGRLGHRGLAQSCALIGAGLGIRFDEIRTTIDPVVATPQAPRAGVAPGRVAGLRQTAVGVRDDGRPVVHLDLEMSIAAPNPRDRIRIEGDPPLDVVVAGGTHGDRGTVATVLNAIPAVVAARPGLLRVIDLPLYGPG